jgi:hypothetical protein
LADQRHPGGPLFSTRSEGIARKGIVFAAALLLLSVYCSRLSARPTTAAEAGKVVTGWLKADVCPLGTVLGRHIKQVETFTDGAGEPIYHVVYLQPSGFVIVSADDSVEPIIAFSDDSDYDPSPANPLGALVGQDLRERVVTARLGSPLKAIPRKPTPAEHRNKWNKFTVGAEASDDTLTFFGMVSPSNVCVGPLLQSKWGQSSACSNTCYNYYTPDNYRSGCVATAMAQLMRYHRHPLAAIGQLPFLIRKDSGSEYWVYTRGGDGYGGPYHWSDMALVPGCDTTLTQREAIGALCYDAAISIGTNFGSSSSEADTLKAKDALIDAFQYGNAVKAYNGGANIGGWLIYMINPNLDAKDPVILGVKGLSSHAVVCDGYGYNFSTLYHHISMGWSGVYDAWYNLPAIDSTPAYSSVVKCIYNIHITDGGSGEVISGRILDHIGNPIANAAVYARVNGRGTSIATYSDSAGIYAFDCLSSNTTYIINVIVTGYVFQSQTAATGTSRDNFAYCGNVWGVDFDGDALHIGDLNHDSVVDLADFAVLTSAWLSHPGDNNWNPYCDISAPADNFIDVQDLAVLVQGWLAGGQ